jgi:acetoin utilization protein AcuC
LPDTWLDRVEDWDPIPRRSLIEEKNRKTIEIAKLYLPKS